MKAVRLLSVGFPVLLAFSCGSADSPGLLEATSAKTVKDEPVAVIQSELSSDRAAEKAVRRCWRRDSRRRRP